MKHMNYANERVSTLVVEKKMNLKAFFKGHNYDEESINKALVSQILITPNPINITSDLTNTIFNMFEQEGIPSEKIIDQKIKLDIIKNKKNELQLLLETQIKSLELRHNLIQQQQILVDKYLFDLRENFHNKLDYFNRQDLSVDQLANQIEHERKFINRLQNELNRQHELLDFKLEFPDISDTENRERKTYYTLSDLSTESLPKAFDTSTITLDSPISIILPILIYAGNQVASIGTNLVAAWLYDTYVKPFIDKIKKVRLGPKTKVVYEYVIREEKSRNKLVVTQHQKIEGDVEDVIRLMQAESKDLRITSEIKMVHEN